MKTGAMKNHISLTGVNKFLPVLVTFIVSLVGGGAKIGTGDLHTMLFSSCEFRENQHKESRTFLIGIHEIIPVSVP
jgi:hypothetical protein